MTPPFHFFRRVRRPRTPGFKCEPSFSLNARLPAAVNPPLGSLVWPPERLAFLVARRFFVEPVDFFLVADPEAGLFFFFALVVSSGLGRLRGFLLGPACLHLIVILFVTVEFFFERLVWLFCVLLMFATSEFFCEDCFDLDAFLGTGSLCHL